MEGIIIIVEPFIEWGKILIERFRRKEPTEVYQAALEDLLNAARMVKTNPEIAEVEIIKRVEELDLLKEAGLDKQ